jgi:hypothetical protein
LARSKKARASWIPARISSGGFESARRIESLPRMVRSMTSGFLQLEKVGHFLVYACETGSTPWLIFIEEQVKRGPSPAIRHFQSALLGHTLWAVSLGMSAIVKAGGAVEHAAVPAQVKRTPSVRACAAAGSASATASAAIRGRLLIDASFSC